MKRVIIIPLMFLSVFVSAQTQSAAVTDGLKHSGVAYVQSASDASVEVFTVMASFKLVEQGAMTSQDALQKYNNGLGKSLGTAKTLKEAEKLVREKGFSYMEIKAIKGMANDLMKKL